MKEDLVEFARAKEFLEKQGVLQEIIDKLEFTETKRGIMICMGNVERFTMVPEADSFRLARRLPFNWFPNRVNEVELKNILNAHPLKDSFESIFCYGSRTGTVISIVPKSGIPFRLKNSISGPAMNAEQIAGWFAVQKIIEEPEKNLTQEAFDLMSIRFFDIKRKYEMLRVPDGVSYREDARIFRKSCPPFETAKFYVEHDCIVFFAQKFSVRYDASSLKFLEVEEPYTALFKKLGKCQAMLSEAVSLRKKINKSGNRRADPVDMDLDTLQALICVNYHNEIVTYELNNDSYIDDAKNIWELHQKKFIEDKEEDRRIREERERRIRESDCYGSLIAECIVDIVKANMRNWDCQGIPLSVLVKMVRGIKTTHYPSAKRAGKFGFFSPGYVENMIRELEDFGILSLEFERNRFTTFENVCFKGDELTSLIRMRSGSFSCTEYTDHDWLEEIRNHTHRWPWKDMLSLLDHPAVYCVAAKPFIDYFRQAPEDVIECIRIFSKTGDKTKKKLCKLLLEEIRPQEKINQKSKSRL